MERTDGSAFGADRPADRPPNRHFAAGREFSLIESLFDESHFSRTGEGLGDDAYLLKAGGETWAVSTDASVEGIHYRLDWSSPAGALEKALLSNLSDINAMGGRTALAFLALGVPAAWGDAEIASLRETMRALESRFGFRVGGGDTVRTPAGSPSPMASFFSITVLGPVRGRPLLRSQARPGHGIYVSGSLGSSAAGLALLERGLRPDPPSAPSAAAMGSGGAGGTGGVGDAVQAAIAAHLRPSPPLGLGPFLASLPGPVAAIDLSDGLSSELWHLSRQSGCRMAVEWSKLPYERELIAAGGGGPEDARNRVLHGGEDYQLLFTGDFSGAELAAMGAHARVTRIGDVEAGAGVVLREPGGREADLEPGGWSH
jgi:thiamine-monophosphate kinase